MTVLPWMRVDSTRRVVEQIRRHTKSCSAWKDMPRPGHGFLLKVIRRLSVLMRMRHALMTALAVGDMQQFFGEPARARGV